MKASAAALGLVAARLLAAPGAQAFLQQGTAEAAATANPIRKVVTILQAMQKKVTEEGEKEKELYEKFMCYCTSSGGTLTSAISAADAKVPALGSDIETAESQKAQAEEDLKKAQADRSAAKAAMAEATGLREKEAAAVAAEKAEYDTNIAAIKKAVTALEKGMSGGFLQTSAAATLKKLALAKQDMIDADRQEILAFLAGGQGEGYTPASGEVTGILKELGDEMAKSLAETTAEEVAAIKTYEEIMTAKTKEVKATNEKIEAKTQKIGELGVSIVQLKADLDDTSAALLEDKKFLANLEQGCSTKTAEWEERSKTRATELVALADTIKVLNDDDALDLFKKMLPSTSASFVQVRMSGRVLRQRALDAIHDAWRKAREAGSRAPLDLLALALSGKAGSQAGFEKVLKMIDDMVALLKQEQLDDDHKKEYCGKQFDFTDDKKKELERGVGDLEAAIASAEEGIATLKDEIAALEAGIVKLDKGVADATVQRKAENQEYAELMASNSAAKELLGYAKNRLNKFYNPKLYKPPAKTELSAQDKIFTSMGGTPPPTKAPGGIAGTGVAVLAQVAAHEHRLRSRKAFAAPLPPPETFGAYATKAQESTGVIAMIDLLIKDLDKEMTEAETEEKNAQTEYEELMGDSAEKRTLDSKSLTAKGAAKADLEADLENHKSEKTATVKELMAAEKYIANLHAECDWLLQYFDVRKEARGGEIDSLAKAKAILSGADFALLQIRIRGAAPAHGFLAPAA